MADDVGLEVQVEVLEWPVEAERLAEVRAAGLPRLLLVLPPDRAPVVDDHLEDWVRAPADADEVRLRCRRLARLASEAASRRTALDPEPNRPTEAMPLATGRKAACRGRA